METCLPGEGPQNCVPTVGLKRLLLVSLCIVIPLLLVGHLPGDVSPAPAYLSEFFLFISIAVEELFC